MTDLDFLGIIHSLGFSIVLNEKSGIWYAKKKDAVGNVVGYFSDNVVELYRIISQSPYHMILGSNV